MSDTFHAEISIEEFKYAIGIWSAAVAGKLPVPEILNIPADSGPTVFIDISIDDNKKLAIYKPKDHPSLPAYLTILKEFSTDNKKRASILLHCLIYEKILLSPLFKSYIDNLSIFRSPCLDLIKDIPIKIGNEEMLNDLNMEYILEKFRDI